MYESPVLSLMGQMEELTGSQGSTLADDGFGRCLHWNTIYDSDGTELGTICLDGQD